MEYRYLVHIKPSRCIVQQIWRCHKNMASCLYLQSIQQHHRGSHTCGVNMEDDTAFRPHIFELPQTCIYWCRWIFHRSRCAALQQCCCCLQQQESMKQRTNHHLLWNGRRSPGMYARHTGRSFWLFPVLVAARVKIVSSKTS